MPSFCYNCGSALPEGVKFCPICGQATSGEPAAGETTVLDQHPQAQVWNQAHQAAPAQDQYAYQNQNQGQYQGYEAQSGYQPQQPQQPQQAQQSWQSNQPQQSWQSSQPQQSWQQPPAKKKSKTGLILGLVLLLLAGLAAVACFVWPGFLNKEETTAPTTATSAPKDTQAPGTTAETALPTTGPETEAPTEAPSTEPAPTETPNPYLDVIETDPCYAEYLWAFDHHVVGGGYLKGDQALTRGEAILLLWKALGTPAADISELPFTDVTVADDCYPAVLWAYGKGYISGTDEGIFSPDDTMTRGQAIFILCRAADGNGEGLPMAYTDIKEGKYYYDAVNWGFASGILDRWYYLEFYPSELLNRGDFLCWLARTMEPDLALIPQAPDGDSFADYGMEFNLTEDNTAYFLAQPRNDDAARMRLSVQLEYKESFTGTETLPGQEGYEWRVACFLIGYGDENAKNYGYSLCAAVCDSNTSDLFDYYSMQSYGGEKTCWVYYSGGLWPVTVLPMEAEEVEGALYRVTFKVLVPVGYEGLAVRFNSMEAEPTATDSFLSDSFQSQEDFVFYRFN